VDSFVYFIGDEHHGPVKIGISGSPEVRCAQLQPGNPQDLIVLIQFRGGEEEEQALHKLFAAERLRGEWFQRSARIKKFMEMIRCNVAPYMAMEQCNPEAIRAAKARARKAAAQAKKREEFPALMTRMGATMEGLNEGRSVFRFPAAARRFLRTIRQEKRRRGLPGAKDACIWEKL
jgi:hypothetical protein